MSTVQSIERAFNILDVIAAESNGISVTETSKRVQLPLSTVSRLILTLERLGAVERLENERVRIGKRLINMTLALSAEERLIHLAKPFLKDIAFSIGEDAALVVPDGTQARFIAQESGGQVIQVQDWTGSKFPLHTLTAGKLFLAYQTPEKLEHYLSQPLVALTEKTLITKEGLLEAINELRTTGICWSFSEFAADLNAVSTPILINHQTIVACLTVYGPSFRFPKSQASVSQKMHTTARDLSNLLSKAQ